MTGENFFEPVYVTEYNGKARIHGLSNNDIVHIDEDMSVGMACIDQGFYFSGLRNTGFHPNTGFLEGIASTWAVYKPGGEERFRYRVPGPFDHYYRRLTPPDRLIPYFENETYAARQRLMADSGLTHPNFVLPNFQRAGIIAERGMQLAAQLFLESIFINDRGEIIPISATGFTEEQRKILDIQEVFNGIALRFELIAQEVLQHKKSPAELGLEDDARAVIDSYEKFCRALLEFAAKPFSELSPLAVFVRQNILGKGPEAPQHPRIPAVAEGEAKIEGPEKPPRPN